MSQATCKKDTAELDVFIHSRPCQDDHPAGAATSCYMLWILFLFERQRNRVNSHLLGHSPKLEIQSRCPHSWQEPCNWSHYDASQAPLHREMSQEPDTGAGIVVLQVKGLLVCRKEFLAPCFGLAAACIWGVKQPREALISLRSQETDPRYCSVGRQRSNQQLHQSLS